MITRILKVITQISRVITQILICEIMLFFPLCSHAQGIEEWITAQGRFCTLYINKDVDMEALSRKIDTYRVDFGLTEKPTLPGQKPEDEVLYKFDLVFVKVQELLDMRPPKMHLTAKIYQTKADLDKIYFEVFNERGDLIAFYVFKLNTLFACVENISVEVIAHEMAHCIVDHHFIVPPPQKIGELIAHYAELHLKE
jgi:hypothetical protein